jgi:DNA-directed RNA polymerase subunit F
MIGKTSKGEEAVSLARVKEILEERKKVKELTYEQQLAYEHASKFAIKDVAKEEKLRKALEGFNLSDKALLKIIDIMPKTPFTLRQILMKENRAFTDEEISKIVATIKEHG